MNAANWVVDAVAQFGRQLGISRLGFGQGTNALSLAFADGGVLGLEQVQRDVQTEVLVYFSRPVGHQPLAILRTALRRAHVSQGGPWMVQVALSGQGTDTMLTAMVRLPERGLNAQQLGHATDYLDRWLSDLQNARTP